MTQNTIRGAKDRWLSEGNLYPSGSFIGRASADEGRLEVLDIATVIAMLGIGSSNHNDLSGLQGGNATERYHLTAAELLVVQNTSGVNTGNQTITLTGDVTGSGTGSFAATLATVNSNIGSFGSATQVGTFAVNGKGLITSASNTAISIASSAVTDFTEAAQDAIGAMVDATIVYVDGTPLLTRGAISGDISIPQASNTSTLATVNANVGSFGSATAVGVFTANAKGLITAASSTSIQIAESQVTSLVTDLAAKQPLDAALTAIAGVSWVQGDLGYWSGVDTASRLAKDTNATRYLSNTGSSNNPAWAQINLANGVTGDLPFANLTQGSALSVLGVAGNATADNASIAAASDGQVLRRSGTSIGFGSVLGSSLSGFTQYRIAIGNSTGGLEDSSLFKFNPGTSDLTIGGFVFNPNNDETSILRSSSATSSGLAFETSDSVVRMLFGGRTTNAFFSKPTAYPLRIENYEDNSLGELVCGNLGVNTGTPNPDAKVDVAGTPITYGPYSPAEFYYAAESYTPINYSMGDTINYRIWSRYYINGNYFYSSTYYETGAVTITAGNSAVQVLADPDPNPDGLVLDYLVERDYNGGGFNDWVIMADLSFGPEDGNFGGGNFTWNLGSPPDVSAVTGDASVGTKLVYNDGANDFSIYADLKSYFADKVGIKTVTPSALFHISGLAEAGSSTVFRIDSIEHSSAATNEMSLYDSTGHESTGMAVWAGGGGTGGYGAIVLGGYGNGGIRLGEISGKNNQNTSRTSSLIFQTGSTQYAGQVTLYTMAPGGSSFVHCWLSDEYGHTGYAGVTSPTAKVHIGAGSTAANSAPLKLNSGSLNTAAEAGAFEFLTDDVYFTQTTNTTRHNIAWQDNPIPQQVFS